MPELTQDEIDALLYASDEAGKYLDGLGKTDMATFTEEEWMTLIETIFLSASHKLSELISKKEIPF